MKIAAAGTPRLWTDQREDTGPSPTFATALAVAGALHLLLVLGVGFELPDPETARSTTRPLEVVVLRQAAPSEKKPEIADAFAQVDREGGGMSDEAEPGLRPEPQPEVMPAPAPPADDPEPITPPPRSADPAKPTEPPPQAPDRAVLTAGLQAQQPVEDTPVAPPPEPEVPPEPVPELTEIAPEPAPDLPELAPETPPLTATAAQIMASRSLEIAQLTARIEQNSNAYAKRQRRKAISASTREYKYANYLEAWRRKVERIGNLNYPDEAKKHKLYGSLILHVALSADGSIEQIRVLRSSGFDVLDQAAVRIVELAAPFAPFPPDIKSETDVLDITRTWQFLSSNRLGWDN